MSEPDLERINNTMGKMLYHLSTHNSVLVSVSGGSDSDIIVHMICTYFRDMLPKCHFVFFDTGLEFLATKKHLEYLENKYGIQINKRRGMPIPRAIHKYGTPILSKDFSAIIEGVQTYNRPSSWVKFNTQQDAQHRRGLTPKMKTLGDFCLNNHFIISAKCCDKAKKQPMHHYVKEINADLNVTGERQAEGGVRATKHKDCFEPRQGKAYDKYMPLWFWSDETKQWYKEHEGITYSDCYEVWGMKRTGCVGCPFGSDLSFVLPLLNKYEPNMYKACMNLFGRAYYLLDKFSCKRKKILTPQEYAVMAEKYETKEEEEIEG